MGKTKRKTKVLCGHCPAVAAWKILWADGRACWSTCEAHKELGVQTIRKNGKWSEIVSITRVPK